MAITFERSAAPPSGTGMGQPEGTDIISANFQGSVQLSKIAYLGGKNTIGQIPQGQYNVTGMLVDPDPSDSWVNPIPALPESGTDLVTYEVDTGEVTYSNAVRTGGAIQSRDMGSGHKTLMLSNIYTIFGELITS